MVCVKYFKAKKSGEMIGMGSFSTDTHMVFSGANNWNKDYKKMMMAIPGAEVRENNRLYVPKKELETDHWCDDY